GHEVVADGPDAGRGHRPEAVGPGRDVLVARRARGLDLLADRDALDGRPRQAVRGEQRGALRDALARPGDPGGHVVQGRDHALEARHLAELRQRDGVLGTEPPERVDQAPDLLATRVARRGRAPGPRAPRTAPRAMAPRGLTCGSMSVHPAAPRSDTELAT